MNNAKLLSLGISDAFDWLDQVVNDLTPEQWLSEFYAKRKGSGKSASKPSASDSKGAAALA